jgi:hypothetical protein
MYATQRLKIPMSHSTDHQPARTAFTLVELIVICTIVGLMLSMVIPVLRHLRSDSGKAVSMSNLANQGAMHAMYAADWSDRQFTTVPDNLGQYSTTLNPIVLCNIYVNQTGCYPSVYMGITENGSSFYVNLAPCQGTTSPGASCSGAGYSWPYPFVQPILATPPLSTFRFVNIAALSSYADGRFYDDVFYAPNDVVTYAGAEPQFGNPAQMPTVPDPPVFSSYCTSPAAMFHPDVFTPASRGGPTWQFTFADRFKSPTVSQATYTDLKTQIIEHNWNQSPPGEFNPAVARWAGQLIPYQFNHGLDSAPMTLFFDGHIASIVMAEALTDDMTVKRQTRGSPGLWSRDSPLGPNGYKGEVSYDGTLSGLHILTVGGITGRDVLTAP